MPSYASPSTPPPPTSGLPQELEDYYLNFGEPGAGFYRFLQEQGLTGVRPADAWSQSQYSRYYNQWLSEAGKQPELGFYDYLQGVRPQDEFQSLSPESRGVNTRITAPRGRWSY